MADLRPQYTEEAVGANHPTKTDVINRAYNVEHGIDGTHSKAITQLTASKLVKADASKILTASAMAETANGEVTNASQPCFVATLTAEVENVTGDDTVYSLAAAIWTEVKDQNSDFLNGTFTAPVDGTYHFNIHIIWDDWTANHTRGILSLVASNRTKTCYFNPTYDEYNSNTGRGTLDKNMTVDMDAADTFYVTVVFGATDKTIDIFSALISGFLIC